MRSTPTPLADAFVIYQGSHGDNGAERADIILPGCAYSEKSGTYMNLEGRPQQTNRAIFPPNEAKEDWAILRGLSASLGAPLKFNTLRELRTEMYAAHPRLAAQDQVDPASIDDILALAKGDSAKLSADPLPRPILDYYLTNPIARASKVMAEMSALQYQETEKATGTHD